MFGGQTKAQEEEEKRGGAIRDVDSYFTQVQALIKKYRRVVEKLEDIKKDKKATNRRLELLTERGVIKDEFIAKKHAARANIRLLKGGLDVIKERELRELQEEYRQVDNDFRSLGILAEKDALMEGGTREGRVLAGSRDGFDPTRAKNDDLLDRAGGIQQDTLAKLKQGLATVESTKEQGKFTAAQLEQDREKMKRIDSGLDVVQSEMELSQVLLTRFVKRLATDKVVIAFATLLVLGIVGIIIYAALNPGQNLFAVPSVVIPPIVTPSPTPSVSATPFITPSASSTPPARRLLGAALRGALENSLPRLPTRTSR